MRARTDGWLRALAVPLAIGIVGSSSPIACTGATGQRAAEGAGTGAAAGAVGGLLTAVVFGGDPLEGAARGAVWGAGAGAVAGAVQGSREDAIRAEQARARTRSQTEAELARLRQEIGDDNYAGLEALTDCKHEVALAYAKTASRSRNRDYALAGLWLGALTTADQQGVPAGLALAPRIVEADPHHATQAQVERTLRDTLDGLRSIRTEYDLPARCS